MRPVESTRSQFVFSSQPNSNQKRNYQDRKNFMNIASVKAGARIYELNCYDPETAQSNLIAKNRQQSTANCSKCKDLKPLIDEKNSENWSYLEQKGSLYLEFREAARIYALGLEFYSWEAKWFISNQGRFVVKGIKLTSDNQVEETWKEAELIEIEIGGYDEIQEFDEKIKLYYNCKLSQCYEKYQAIILELHNPNPNNLKNNIEKIFVFERF